MLVSLLSGRVEAREQASPQKKDYQNRDDIKDIIRCISGLPLLPAADIPAGLQEIRATTLQHSC